MSLIELITGFAGLVILWTIILTRKEPSADQLKRLREDFAINPWKL